MKTLKTLRQGIGLLVLALGVAAHAADVGDQIEIDRSQVKCVERAGFGGVDDDCAYCYMFNYGYGYGYYGYYGYGRPASVRITLDLEVDGIKQFSAVSTLARSCQKINEVLDTTVPLIVEVTSKSVDRVSPHLIRVEETVLLNALGIELVGVGQQ